LLCEQLLQAGWDACASDLAGEVAARQDQAPRREAWSLVIDRSGRWRFTATHQVGMVDSRELAQGGHRWRLTKEKQQILTVAGNLRSHDALPELLAELSRLAQEECGPPAPGAEGEPSWRENHATHAEMIDL
jgi:hypothetical protein